MAGRRAKLSAGSGAARSFSETFAPGWLGITSASRVAGDCPPVCATTAAGEVAMTITTTAVDTTTAIESFAINRNPTLRDSLKKPRNESRRRKLASIFADEREFDWAAGVIGHALSGRATQRPSEYPTHDKVLRAGMHDWDFF